MSVIDKLREQIQRRTPDSDLFSLIDKIEAGTYKPAISDRAIGRLANAFPELDPTTNTRNLGALLVWQDRARIMRDKLKPERNAIIAAMLPKVWEHAKARWSSVESEAGNEIFRDDARVKQFNDAADFQDLVYGHFVLYLVQWRIECARKLDRLEKAKTPRGQWPPHIKAFARFQKMMGLYKSQNGVPMDEASFIARGVGTATYAIWSLIELVPKLARAKEPPLVLSNEQINDAVRSAYGPLITMLSSTNIEIGPLLLKGLGNKEDPRVGFDLKNFTLLSDGKGSYKLVFDHNALEKIVDDGGRKMLDQIPNSRTTWCPVRYTGRKRRGGEVIDEPVDVMRELFEHCLTLADKHYYPYRNPQ